MKLTAEAVLLAISRHYYMNHLLAGDTQRRETQSHILDHGGPICVRSSKVKSMKVSVMSYLSN